MYGNPSILNAYETHDEAALRKLASVDEEVFQLQLQQLRTFKNTSTTNEIFIVPDVHGSLIMAFAPLIEGGIIKEGSISFVDGKFTYTLLPERTNKVVYCGDVIARGANRHNPQILDTLLTLASTIPDNVVFVCGNHEIWFMNPFAMPVMNQYILDDYGRVMNEGEMDRIRRKIRDYFISNPNAIAYIFTIGDTSYIVSHTILYDAKTYKNHKNEDVNGMQTLPLSSTNRVDLHELHSLLVSSLTKAHDEQTWNDFKKLSDVVYSHPRPLKEYRDRWIFTLRAPLATYATPTDQLVWFVGHNPVQELPQEQRVIRDKNVTIHFLDVNTPNNIPTEMGYKKPYGVEPFSYGVEHLYYAKIKGDSITFRHEWFTNDRIRDILESITR